MLFHAVNKFLLNNQWDPDTLPLGWGRAGQWTGISLQPSDFSSTATQSFRSKVNMSPVPTSSHLICNQSCSFITVTIIYHTGLFQTNLNNKSWWLKQYKTTTNCKRYTFLSQLTQHHKTPPQCGTYPPQCGTYPPQQPALLLTVVKVTQAKLVQFTDISRKFDLQNKRNQWNSGIRMYIQSINLQK